MALSGRIFGFQLLVDARPAGAHGRRRGRAAVPDRAALVGPAHRARGRRPARGDAGRGADVPVQQPRRDARADHGRGARTRRPGRSTPPDAAPGPGGSSPPAPSSGLGFLTKQLQVLLVVPALALTVLVVAPSRPRRRVGDLLAGGAAVIVSAGWYVALVELWPASSRPYIGGSTTNSLLELALGYNGLGRILGAEGNPGGGPGGGPPAGVPPGGMGGAGWGSRRRRLRRLAGCPAPVHVRVLGPGVLAPARGARAARRRALGPAPRAAHRPHPRSPAARRPLDARARRWSSAR